MANFDDGKTFWKFALVLFDYDGYTTIIETKRLEGYNGTLTKSMRCQISYDCRMHSVEILELSDTENELARKDKHWGNTHRAEAICKLRDSREGSRRGKYGGYLNVWPEDSDSEATSPEEETTETRKRKLKTDSNVDSDRNAQKKQKAIPRHAAALIPTLAPNQVSRSEKYLPESKEATEERATIQGSNNRSVTILFEGSGDYDGKASSERQPRSFDNLSRDEEDIINLHLENHTKNRKSVATSTDSCIVISEDSEIQNLLARTVQKSITDMHQRLEKIETKVDLLLHLATKNAKPADSLIEISDFPSDFLTDINLIAETSTPKTRYFGVEILDEQTLPAIATPRRANKTSRKPSARQLTRSTTKEQLIDALTDKQTEMPTSKSTKKQQTLPVQPNVENIPPTSQRNSEKTCIQQNTDDISDSQMPQTAPTCENDIQKENTPITVQGTEMPSTDMSQTQPTIESDVERVQILPTAQLNVDMTLAPTDQPSNETMVQTEILQTLPMATTQMTVSESDNSSPTNQENRALQCLDFNIANLQNQHVQLDCFPGAQVCSIVSPDNLPEGNFEFRVDNRILWNIKSNSNSSGNFLWQVCKRIFKDEEMVKRNFYGRRGGECLSPRRKHVCRFLWDL